MEDAVNVLGYLLDEFGGGDVSGNGAFTVDRIDRLPARQDQLIVLPQKGAEQGSHGPARSGDQQSLLWHFHPRFR